MSVKINTLEIENVKRIKAVKVKPGQNGLTVIGGNNAQGKTSILDAIAWALCGDRYIVLVTRDGSLIPLNLKVTLSNGLVVERKGKNSDLKVTDPDGNKAGQNLLCYFLLLSNKKTLIYQRYIQIGADDRIQFIVVADDCRHL